MMPIQNHALRLEECREKPLPLDLQVTGRWKRHGSGMTYS
jgi:hypothetical protein